MPEVTVTDTEIVALVCEHSPALGQVVGKLVDEKDAEMADLRDRLAGLAAAWGAVAREPMTEFDRAFQAAAGLLREVLGVDGPPPVPLRGLAVSDPLEPHVAKQVDLVGDAAVQARGYASLIERDLREGRFPEVRGLLDSTLVIVRGVAALAALAGADDTVTGLENQIEALTP